MKVMVLAIVIGALDRVTKRLVQGLEDLKISGDTIQTTDYLVSARILRRVMETWGNLLWLKLHWKQSANITLVWKTFKWVK